MNFDLKPDLKRGRSNKLKVGQKVTASKRLVEWYATHTNCCWGIKDLETGDKEVPKVSLRACYSWVRAYLTGELPKGTVKYYGASDDWSEKAKKNIKNRKNVWVEFKFKTTEFGNETCGHYVSEEDLTWVEK